MRHLREDEKILLRKLIKSDNQNSKYLKELDNCFVQDINDGGMGSLLFINFKNKKRSILHSIATAQFNDSDGIIVIASLFLDKDEELFELDMWKTDYSSLIRYPNIDEIEIFSEENCYKPEPMAEDDPRRIEMAKIKLGFGKNALELAIEKDLADIRNVLNIGPGETYNGKVTVNGQDIYYKAHHVNQKNFLSIGKVAPVASPYTKIGKVTKAAFFEKKASLGFEKERQPGFMRDLYQQEKIFLNALISKLDEKESVLDALVGCMVQDMADGGMGSLKFCLNQKSLFGRASEIFFPPKLSAIAVEGRFIDNDGVPVFSSIYLDQYNRLLELDMWKVDFSRLKCYPKIDEIEVLGD